MRDKLTQDQFFEALQHYIQLNLDHLMTPLATRYDAKIFEAKLLYYLNALNTPYQALEMYNDWFENPIGYGYVEVGRKRGWFEYGLRLTTALIETIYPSSEDSYHRYLLTSMESGLVSVQHERVLFLTELGRLKEAEATLRYLAFNAQHHYQGVNGQCLGQFPARLNLGDLLIMQGRLTEADSIISTVIRAYESEEIEDDRRETQGYWLKKRANVGEYTGPAFSTGLNPYACKAWIDTLQGRVGEALAGFKAAEKFQNEKLEGTRKVYQDILTIQRYEKSGKILTQEEKIEIRSRPVQPLPLVGQAGVYYGMLLTRLGKLQSAEKVLSYNLRWAAHPDYHYPTLAALASVALSDVYRLMGKFSPAIQLIEEAMDWSESTHQQEIRCLARLSLARLYFATNEIRHSFIQARKALAIADECGFGLYQIDCRILMARLALPRDYHEFAYENVKKALYAASNVDCSYAWSHAAGLHLLAEVRLHPGFIANNIVIGYTELARITQLKKLLHHAIRIRERIRDPRLANSQELLTKVSEMEN